MIEIPITSNFQNFEILKFKIPEITFLEMGFAGSLLFEIVI
jgi:hypothetical protein